MDKRRDLPPFSALRAFEAFARHGRMLRAADELCVTHGAVSRQVRALQDWLGVSLVEGPRTDLRLTPAGRQLADVLDRAFDDIQAGLPRRARAAQSVLRVSCLGTFAMRWLIPRLPRFYRDHPQIAVEVSESHAPVDFRTGGYDAAIRMQSAARVAGPDITAFLPDYQGPVVAPSVWAEHAAGAGLDGLTRLHTRTYPEGWAEWEARTGWPPSDGNAGTFFDHTFYMLAAASAGLGVAIGGWSLVQDDLADGQLVAPLGLADTGLAYVYVRPAGQAHAAAAAFGDWLVEEGRRCAGPPPELRAPAQPG